MDTTQLDLYLHQGPSHSDVSSGLDALRQVVLHPDNADALSELRIYIWLILLNAPPLNADAYLDLVRQGASPAYAKIRDDTFRTLTTDPLFRRRVTENSLTRVLNAVAWRLHDAHEARVNGWMSPPALEVPKSLNGPEAAFHSPASVTARWRGSVTGTEGSEAGDNGNNNNNGGSSSSNLAHSGYVQGMNVMAAPFLYAARSEAEAFAAFEQCISHEVPAYVRSNMEGVHKGLALVDCLLEIVDPPLFVHLVSRGMKAEIYAFPSVLTFCACTPPLTEVLHLWDFLFAYGPHLNLLCIVCQLYLIRDQLLGGTMTKPDFKPLRSREVIALTRQFAPKIPEYLQQEMLLHAK